MFTQIAKRKALSEKEQNFWEKDFADWCAGSAETIERLTAALDTLIYCAPGPIRKQRYPNAFTGDGRETLAALQRVLGIVKEEMELRKVVGHR